MGDNDCLEMKKLESLVSMESSLEINSEENTSESGILPSEVPIALRRKNRKKSVEQEERERKQMEQKLQEELIDFEEQEQNIMDKQKRGRKRPPVSREDSLPSSETQKSPSLSLVSETEHGRTLLSVNETSKKKQRKRSGESAQIFVSDTCSQITETPAIAAVGGDVGKGSLDVPSVVHRKRLPREVSLITSSILSLHSPPSILSPLSPSAPAHSFVFTASILSRARPRLRAVLRTVNNVSGVAGIMEFLLFSLRVGLDPSLSREMGLVIKAAFTANKISTGSAPVAGAASNQDPPQSLNKDVPDIAVDDARRLWSTIMTQLSPVSPQQCAQSLIKGSSGDSPVSAPALMTSSLTCVLENLNEYSSVAVQHILLTVTANGWFDIALKKSPPAAHSTATTAGPPPILLPSTLGATCITLHTRQEFSALFNASPLVALYAELLTTLPCDTGTASLSVLLRGMVLSKSAEWAQVDPSSNSDIEKPCSVTSLTNTPITIPPGPVMEPAAASSNKWLSGESSDENDLTISLMTHALAKAITASDHANGVVDVDVVFAGDAGVMEADLVPNSVPTGSGRLIRHIPSNHSGFYARELNRIQSWVRCGADLGGELPDFSRTALNRLPASTILPSHHDLDQQAIDAYAPWISSSANYHSALYWLLSACVCAHLAANPGVTLATAHTAVPVLTLRQAELLLQKLQRSGLVKCVNWDEGSSDSSPCSSYFLIP